MENLRVELVASHLVAATDRRRVAWLAVGAGILVSAIRAPGGDAAAHDRRHGSSGKQACLNHCKSHGISGCADTCRRRMQPR